MRIKVTRTVVGYYDVDSATIQDLGYGGMEDAEIIESEREGWLSGDVDESFLIDNHEDKSLIVKDDIKLELVNRD